MPSPAKLLWTVFFRNLMVDTIVFSSNGYRLGALGKWASGVDESLSTAIGDFPKRGILVSHFNS
jgi:hypothetical protein